MASLKNSVSRRKFSREPLDVDDLTSASSFSGIRDVIESHFGKSDSPGGASPAIETDPTRLQYVWDPEDAPIVVRLSVELIDRLEKESLDIFRTITSRGSEIGGILLGQVVPEDPLTVVVEDYEPIPCSYNRGPTYRLTEEEEKALKDAVARRRESGDLIVGFFRSNTRPTLALTDDDLALFYGNFPEERNIFLLVKPFSRKPCVGAIFVREGRKMRRESSYLEFPFSRAELEKNDSLQPGIRLLRQAETASAPPALSRATPPPVEPEPSEPEPEDEAPVVTARPVPFIPVEPVRVEPPTPPPLVIPPKVESPAQPAAESRLVWRRAVEPQPRVEPKPEVRVEPQVEPPKAPETPEPPPQAERPRMPWLRQQDTPKPVLPKVEPPAQPTPRTESRLAWRSISGPSASAPPRVEPKVEARIEPSVERKVEPALGAWADEIEAEAEPKVEPEIEAEASDEPVIEPAPPPPPPPVAPPPPAPPARKVIQPSAVTPSLESRLRWTRTTPPAPKPATEPIIQPGAKAELTPKTEPLPKAEPAPKREPAPLPPLVSSRPPLPGRKPAPPIIEKEPEPEAKPGAAEPLIEFQFGIQSEPQKSSRWWLWLAGLAVLAVIVLVMVFAGGSSKKPRSAAPDLAKAARPEPVQLDMKVEGTANGVLVQWNSLLPVITSAHGGKLTMVEGGATNTINLTAEQVKKGQYTYKPRADDVSIRLDVDTEPSNQSVFGTARVLGATRLMPGKGGARRARTR